jgi:hypothetical protein
VNPATFKFSSRAQLAGGELAGFKAKLRRLLSLPTGGGTQTSATAQADLPAKPAGI